MRKALLFIIVMGMVIAPNTVFGSSMESAESMTFYKGVDLMKLTKDVQRNPLSVEQKDLVMKRALELGATHVAIVTPYDNTSDGIDPTQDTIEWVMAARMHGLFVSHRHMFNEAEGTYDVARNLSAEYPAQMVEAMRQWMIKNTDLIADGDTWTPMPEPQNLGVRGLNCQEQCLFESVDHFNAFIEDIVTVSKETLLELGNRVEVICCGFDGFVVSGNNNPDWEGKSFLTLQTVDAMDNTIAVDHYPQPDWKTGVRRTYLGDLTQLTDTWPSVQFFLTEVGHPDLADAEPVESMFNAFKQFADAGNLRGIWWWPLNASNLDEGLLDANYEPNDLFAQVKNGFALLPDQVAAVSQ